VLHFASSLFRYDFELQREMFSVKVFERRELRVEGCERELTSPGSFAVDASPETRPNLQVAKKMNLPERIVNPRIDALTGSLLVPPEF
jgi:hypothetical protein